MYELVSANEMDDIFDETLGDALDEHGFEQVAPRKWVRSTKAPIRDLVHILAMKGASFVPCWGFSLDFVPHISGSSIRWHRTAKSSMFDLRYDPVDYDIGWMQEWGIASIDRKSTRLNSSHIQKSRMPSSA